MSLTPEFIEKYQIELQNNPNSKVFAPLSEAYRKIGLKKEALALCQEGIKKHPQYGLGHIVMAKLLQEDGQLVPALKHIEIALTQESENMLALNIAAELYILTRSPQKALSCYKHMLFFNPADHKLQSKVKKMESITAKDFDEDIFSMKQLHETYAHYPKENENNFESNQTTDKEPPQLSETKINKHIDRALSLVDAYLMRNDPEQAYNILIQTEKNIGSSPEIEKRKAMIRKRKSTNEPSAEDIKNMVLQQKTLAQQKKTKYLEHLLVLIHKNASPLATKL